MSARDDLATAAGTVEGLRAHAYVVAETDPGTVYPRLDSINYPNVFGGVVTWHVVMVLPQDYAQAERFLEDNAPALKAALDPVLVVTQIRRERLDITGVGILPVAVFVGHREEED